MLIALALRYALEDAGCETIGPATTADHALDLIDRAVPHGAVVDVTLRESCGFTVADALAERGIPFVFASGQPLPDHRRAAHPSTPVLLKPYAFEAVERVLLAPLRMAPLPA